MKRKRPWGWPAEDARRCAVLVFLVFGMAATGPAAAQEPSDQLRLGPIGIMTQAPTMLDVGGGVYDLAGYHHEATGAGDGELRLGQRWFGIGPAIGTLVDFRGSGMAYVGIDSDIAIGPVIVTPLAGLGAWWKGRGDVDLGGTFEFRLSIEAAYALANGARIGLRYGHISNADVNPSNPSENDLMLTYGTPLSL